MSPGDVAAAAHLQTMETPDPPPAAAPPEATPKPQLPPEVGGPKGPEPTRYGDWEVKGRCTDF